MQIGDVWNSYCVMSYYVFNVNLRYFSVKTIGTDIIGHFEKFVFVGKEKNEYIEIKSVHFIKDTLLRIRSLWDF